MNGPLARGLCVALTGLLVGCASGGSGAAPDEGGVRCETDFTRLGSAERVSLRDDVMPIFGSMCAARFCHSGDNPTANLYLGEPVTADIVDRVYQGLLAASTTAPAVPLVTPGDPDASFLVDKLRGTHNSRGYDCISNRADEFIGPCGRAMPHGSSLCELGSASQFNTIAAWVVQGARNE
jgi:hypothetical protein